MPRDARKNSCLRDDELRAASLLSRPVATSNLDRNSEAPTPAVRALRIVIADDERDAADSLAALLETEGHTVRAVYSGRDALYAAAHFAPDVILLDVGMPGISGYEAARRLRERYAEECPALIAVTGWKKASDKILASIVGFDHHLAKPYEPKELLAALAAVTPGKPAPSG